MFGWGERRTNFTLQSGQYSIWAKDTPGNKDVGFPGEQTYGVHPVYMIKENKNLDDYHMVYFKN